MRRGMPLLLTFLGALVLLSACGGGISREARSMVTFSGPFGELQQNPDSYINQTVMLGGRIIENQVSSGVTELLVLQLPLGGSNRPEENGNSQGRFIVRSGKFLDPAIYSPGTLITIVGNVRGSQVRPIGQMPYRYPLIEAIEIHKWERSGQTGPMFHFGIGVGTVF